MESSSIRAFDAPGGIWSVTVWRNDRDLRYVLGGWEGQVFFADGNHLLWSADVGGNQNEVSCVDLDEDGRPEILVWSVNAEPSLYALTANGRLLWEYPSGSLAAFRQVVASRQSGAIVLYAGDELGSIHVLDGRGHLLRKLPPPGAPPQPLFLERVSLGDVDGDGREELLVAASRPSRVLALDKQGGLLWERVGVMSGRSAAQGRIASLDTGDLDADGAAEIVCAGELPFVDAVEVLDGHAAGRTIWENHTFGLYEESCTAKVGRVLAGHDRCVVALSMGQRLFVFDGKGETLFRWSVVPPAMGLTGLMFGSEFVLADVDGDGLDEVVTGSLPYDRHYYVLKVDDRLPAALSQYPFATEATASITRLQGYLSRPLPTPLPRPAKRAFQVIYDWRGTGAPGELARGLGMEIVDPDVVAQVYGEHLAQFNSERLRFAVGPLVYRWGSRMEPRFGKWAIPPMTEAETRARDRELVAMAKGFEERGIPLWFEYAHAQLTSTTTLAEVLQVAPSQFRGVLLREISSDDAELFEDICAVLALFRQLGKGKIIICSFAAFWEQAYRQPEVWERWFAPEYRGLIIPMIKTNDMWSSLELEIGRLVGLFKAGYVDEWGMAIQEDNWRWRTGEFTRCIPPDLMLRLHLLAASLGGTYFRIEGGNSKRFVNVPGHDADTSNLAYDAVPRMQVDPLAEKHRALFYRLTKKGFLQPVEREDLASLSPVALTGDLRSGASQLKALAPHNPSRYVYDAKYTLDAVIPRNPYGLVMILPPTGFPPTIAGVSESIPIHEGRIEVDGQTVPLEDAQDHLTGRLRRHADDLPFQVEGAFLSCQRLEDGYLLYLIDPGYLHAAGANARIRPRVPLRPGTTIQDVLSGERLALQGDVLPVAIPPGTFRLIRVTPT